MWSVPAASTVMSRSVCASSIVTRSIEPIVPPASPIAVATRPSMPGRWSIRTRRTKENWADVGNGTGRRMLVGALRANVNRGRDVGATRPAPSRDHEASAASPVSKRAVSTYDPLRPPDTRCPPSAVDVRRAALVAELGEALGLGLALGVALGAALVVAVAALALAVDVHDPDGRAERAVAAVGLELLAACGPAAVAVAAIALVAAAASAAALTAAVRAPAAAAATATAAVVARCAG